MEAILDCIGIPRLLILKGDKKRRWSSGWKYKSRSFLGDKSVRMGSRIALAVANSEHFSHSCIRNGAVYSLHFQYECELLGSALKALYVRVNN